MITCSTCGRDKNQHADWCTPERRTNGTRCGFPNCDAVIPYRVEWRPFGDGSRGTWTSVIDERAIAEHYAAVHSGTSVQRTTPKASGSWTPPADRPLPGGMR